MKSPLLDFLRAYAKSDTVRAHMPGHKGKGPLGVEGLDITETEGADSLYEACGVIAESERAASVLFGAPTYYSAGGSSLCIKAMLYLTVLYAKERGVSPIVAAGRNAHRSFINAAALVDVQIAWLSRGSSYLSYFPDTDELCRLFDNGEKPIAVYITSPDYLGNIADISKISEICRKNGALLLVDNAHGAYLKFLGTSMHPIDLGADMCCDSAHKTLPALTGAAYLHISDKAPSVLNKMAKYALSVFGSTSPSYLIMASLDALNPYLEKDFVIDLRKFCEKLNVCKQKIINHGYTLVGSEPLKICISAKPFGYRGCGLAEILRGRSIEPEFSDPDYLVLMLSPSNGDFELDRIAEALLSAERREPITESAPRAFISKRAYSPREALLMPSEDVAVNDALGRVLASAGLSCPPAVPIAVMGEIIDEGAIECFKYYGTERVRVLKI